MRDVNPFPESVQKQELRRLHLGVLANRQSTLGRKLAYLGLPSAQMFDVKLWQPVLRHVTAIERDPEVAMMMYRTATLLGIRENTVIIEADLGEVARLLALGEEEAKLAIAELPYSEQNKIRQIRSTSHDVINLDLCGGFLYPDDKGESANVRLLRNLIRSQTRLKAPFILITTFNLRDTGKDDYDRFITESFKALQGMKLDVQDLQQFYLARKVRNQPPQLRRLRFCVPTYLHKIAYEDFQVKSIGAWYYKTFYHTALVFEPRRGGKSLGMPWPPIDEFKELLRAPMIHLAIQKGQKTNEGEIIRETLPAPTLE